MSANIIYVASAILIIYGLRPAFGKSYLEDSIFIQNGTYRKPGVLSGKSSKIVERKEVFFMKVKY